jgi:predicted Zn-dependent protease with MMP-like domain
VTDEVEDPELEQALDALDEGDAEEALRLLEALSTANPRRWIAAAHAWLLLGEARGVDDALARLRDLVAADDPDLLWVDGLAAMASWRLEHARGCFDRLDAAHFGAALLENQALLADLAGDTRAADRLMRRASELDPEDLPPPPRLTPDAFQAVVEKAAQELPEPFQEALEEIAVVIDPMPTAEIVGAPGSGHPPDLLGLFVGPPLAERGLSDTLEPPPTIFLFQRNLERAARDQAQLAEEIRITLYHELGHALGFDEDGVDRLGLG